jgi:hypothetical protein
MKRVAKFLSLLLLICSYFISAAQNRTTDTSATCIAFWKNKVSKIYEITHSKEKSNSSIGNTTAEANYEAHIKVIDSTGEGFTIEWVYKNFKPVGATDNTINSLNSIMEGLKILYKTDDVGTFTELINWKEVRDFALSNYEKVFAKATQNSEFAAALNQVKAIFQSKENIEALLIREVQLFHSPYGVEYSIAGIVTETELPNVTGGAPFPASVTIKLDELNKKMDYCKVSLNQIVDKGKSGPIMATMLKKLAGDKKVDEAEIKNQIKDLEISDLNSFTYSISSGWINKVVYKRIANVGVTKQIETYVITEKK